MPGVAKVWMGAVRPLREVIALEIKEGVLFTHLVPLYCNNWLVAGAVIVASFKLLMPNDTAPVNALTLVTGKTMGWVAAVVILPFASTVI